MSESNRRIVSTSERKNIQEVVYHNIGPDGKKASITRFEPLWKSRPVYNRFKKGLV